jgi:metal-responsive CopG/Arc/MetJ family transcriptional regulator
MNFQEEAMTQRISKTVTVSLPPAMVDELDRVRAIEHRTRSELVREALRRYVSSMGASRRLPVQNALAEENEAVRIAEEEYARGKTVSLEDLTNDLGLATR